MTSKSLLGVALALMLAGCATQPSGPGLAGGIRQIKVEATPASAGIGGGIRQIKVESVPSGSGIGGGVRKVEH